MFRSLWAVILFSCATSACSRPGHNAVTAIGVSLDHGNYDKAARLFRELKENETLFDSLSHEEKGDAYFFYATALRNGVKGFNGDPVRICEIIRQAEQHFKNAANAKKAETAKETLNEISRNEGWDKLEVPPPGPPNPGAKPKQRKGKDLINSVARRVESPEILNWFRQLGLAYQTTDAADGKGPNRLSDLTELAASPLKEWLARGWIEVAWGVRLASVDLNARGRTALAWETAPDSFGERFVLMCDGTVQSVDEESFARMAKAKGR
jgi:hypothetical protein